MEKTLKLTDRELNVLSDMNYRYNDILDDDMSELDKNDENYKDFKKAAETTKTLMDKIHALNEFYISHKNDK